LRSLFLCQEKSIAYSATPNIIEPKKGRVSK